ncbi:serine hydrolase domain-containing protein [Frigidibacter sp. SD6-1]|uniref:serine hydrolase domain-containing protein n=1 Tax=Frigidibacter sp. SD6-1 TaxID=3032581 RepID=UPI0024E00C3C|nr:serine hydrolase domain-containing protein [Frigidibacter sp. SD6-1]
MRPFYLTFLGAALAAALLVAFVITRDTSDRMAGASLQDRLRATIEEVAVEDVPGILLLVDRPGERIELARGVADRETGAPIRIDQTLRAGSICKTYVAALAVMAAREGQVDLDVPISRYLGAATLMKLPEGLDPTVRQLLNHTSGVPDYYSERFYAEDWDRSQPLTTELVLHAIRGLPETNAPGAAFAYSNTNYHLIALILEKVEGRPLADLLRERLLAPLALTQTYYDIALPPGDQIHGYGSPFDPWEDTFAMRENSGPDGGMFMSAGDLVSWLRALYAPGGRFSDIGAEMVAAPVEVRERKLQGLGTEIQLSRSGLKVVGHTGGLDGYLSAGFYVPDLDTVVVLHMNRSDEETFARVLGRVLSELAAQG